VIALALVAARAGRIAFKLRAIALPRACNLICFLAFHMVTFSGSFPLILAAESAKPPGQEVLRQSTSHSATHWSYTARHSLPGMESASHS
jgi:hypothetical protein